MRRRFLALVAVVWAPLLLWWVALLPGGMSNDSFNSWTQIQAGQWSSHHPPPFTAYLWLTSLGGTTPATTSLVDSLLVALALAFFAAVVGHVLRAGRAVYVAAVLLGLLPLVGPFSVMIWKDVPETAALLVLAGLLVLGGHLEGPLPRRWWTAVAVASFVAGLLRWNGGATTVVAGVLVAVALTGSRRWWAAVATAGGGLAGTGVLLLLPYVASVTPVQAIDSQAQKLADLAQFARNSPHAFSHDDRAVLESIAPFAGWRHVAQTCLTVDTVTYYLIRYHGMNDQLQVQSAALSRVWSRVARKAPVELVRARACRASLAWSLADPPRREILTVFPHVTANGYGLHQLSPPLIRDAGRSVAELSNVRWVQVVFWRPMLWLLLLLGAAIPTIRRDGRWRVLVLLLAVPLGVLGSYVAQPAAQDARYTYAATLMFQLAVVAYVVAGVRARRTSSVPGAAEPATADEPDGRSAPALERTAAEAGR
jgi:hypothetical protein